jgi:uncharacterized iron-regulated protein
MAPGRCLAGVAAAALLTGCATGYKTVQIKTLDQRVSPGTIIDTAARTPVSFDTLVSRLAQARIVYVGEKHTDPRHHDIQQRVIEAMARQHPDLVVGMEMFDRTYQPVLDRWASGDLDEAVFLEATHWYANWRYPFHLYRGILDSIRAQGLALVALNIPFHIPPKISIGGIDTLAAEEKRHLPTRIDTTDADHRDFVNRIFSQHRIPGRTDFEKFYLAQCVWEETMAETVAARAAERPMVVLAGSGHIVRKFGIPKRAHARGGHPYVTILPVTAPANATLDEADYLWVTGPTPK